MKIEDLIAALRRLKVQTGSLACLGCGHEHNCSTSGCAIIRAAVDELCGMEWIDAEVELPPEDDVILCVVSGKPRTNLTLDEAIEIASYSPVQMGGSWMRIQSGKARLSPTGGQFQNHRR